jgi:hypothetical protein
MGVAMTESVPEANDADLADQALPVDANGDEGDAFSEDLTAGAEADAADMFEQQRSAPLDDDDYDR